ncbi:hypothetical protein O3P69_000996 [Scylla paramamosain]|uniref:Uncharacterized protein n=1 Tax=Scylla paramamosain TaxID=85552 RepID=A0AAW0UWY0_SCYPA
MWSLAHHMLHWRARAAEWHAQRQLRLSEDLSKCTVQCILHNLAYGRGRYLHQLTCNTRREPRAAIPAWKQMLQWSLPKRNPNQLRIQSLDVAANKANAQSHRSGH